MSIPQTIIHQFECWIEAIKGDFQKFVFLWISLFFVVVRSLWNQINRVVFDRAETDWELFSYLVKLRLGFWLKGYDHKCPFNPGEVASKLECVRLWRTRKEPRPAIAWCPPPLNNLKWNVDGSSNGKPGAAGIGGVLRDDQGFVIAMFSSSCGNKRL